MMSRRTIPCSSTEALLDAATERHRAGDLAAARGIYRQILDDSPAHAVALFRSGLLELQDGGAERALALIGRAAAISLKIRAIRSAWVRRCRRSGAAQRPRPRTAARSRRIHAAPMRTSRWAVAASAG